MVRSIVGMEYRRPARALRLLQGKIEIGQPGLIEEIAISVGQVGPQEYRCVIDNGTQLVFRLRGLRFDQMKLATSRSALPPFAIQVHLHRRTSPERCSSRPVTGSARRLAPN